MVSQTICYYLMHNMGLNQKELPTNQTITKVVDFLALDNKKMCLYIFKLNKVIDTVDHKIY